jgi:putative hydrolase of the HAD superfamily
MRFAELDAVTIDGFGTLVSLVDPVAALHAALLAEGVERSPDQISLAFAAEASFYRPRAHLGRDEQSLGALRQECAAVFLDTLDAPLDPSTFADRFVAALEFAPIPGAVETLELLSRQGLGLAVVANWDCALPQHLARLGLDGFFATVVTSAEAGAAKPDSAPFRLALGRLGVDPARALHVGDEPADEAGARSAGMRFAPAPLATAFEGWR